MIHWKQEGMELKNGFNFYHPKSNHSIGVLLRIGYRIWRARYSKIAKKWFFTYSKTDPNALIEWETKHGQ
mgnify:CR=1 FL=1